MGLIDAILLISLFVALYGLYGFFTEQNGIADPVVRFRSFSVFGSAPTLSMFCSIVIPLAFYRFLFLRGFKRVVVLLIMLLNLATLGLTFTRSTLITVPLSIIVIVFFLPWRKTKLRLLGTLVALGALGFLFIQINNIPLLSRFFQQDIGTLNGRTFLWQAILSHFDPTQILGNGLNASVVLLTNLRVSDSQGVIAVETHNLLLQTLYDQGIIGVILLSLVALALFASLITGVRKTTGAHRILFLTALTIFGSVVLQSLASNDLLNPAIAVYFWVSMALPFAVCWPIPARNTREQPPEAEVEIEDFDDDITIPRTQPVERKSSTPNFMNASSTSQ
jgi:O-antigen ligase